MLRYHAQFPTACESVGLARRAVMHVARSAGLDGAALADFECAVGEALANAVEHGGHGFTVTAEVAGSGLSVEIGDGGCGFAGWNDLGELQPRSTAPRGFGIFIMRSLTDGIEFSEGGRRIRLFKRLPVDYAGTVKATV
jgi:serine/threonine-protein kinase RsbW